MKADWTPSLTQTPRKVIMETNLLVPCAGDRLGVQLFGKQRQGATASDHEQLSKVNSGGRHGGVKKSVALLGPPHPVKQNTPRASTKAKRECATDRQYSNTAFECPTRLVGLI
jgi:hypothetical protein